MVWFKGSPSLRVASRKCLRHFTGVGQLFAKHGFNPSFARFNLPIRCILLITLLLSLFVLPWYISAVVFTILLAEFLYKTIKMYERYRDSAVVYYVVFFTLWSLLSLAIFYGLYLGWRNKRKFHEELCLWCNLQNSEASSHGVVRFRCVHSL